MELNFRIKFSSTDLRMPFSLTNLINLVKSLLQDRQQRSENKTYF